VHVLDVARAMHLAATADASLCAGRVFNVGSDENNVQIAQLAYRVRDAVPSTELVSVGTDPDLRDYNVRFDTIRAALDYRTTRTIDDGIQEVLGALRSGKVDPDDRRGYTLRQYVFLREAELTAQSLAIHGHILGTA
jgi:nucleoside-diphosphate-sugar epimerase